MHQALAPSRQLLLVTVVVLALSAQTGAAATIFGPGQISASTTLPNSGYGFTIDQICDGIIDPPVWFNGFAAAGGLVGTIRLDLATPQDLGDFVLWNDINVSVEGIQNFRLDFFDAADAPLGGTPVLVGPLGSVAPVVYTFAAPVSGVKRVDLVVLTLNPNPYLEIREVAFNEAAVVPTQATSWSHVKALFR
jgi:hypothetical protein